ncbi:uncharacterized protein PHACADRAFT_253318 [Phanerochaete carnosa HHB-10118-sp]|uniref:Uncharacterized protein n=1 Tax=Phanerochaete carnosa (strain HHB-10118-sp) TaxID=650164 RepID=K5X0I8_PHACS|nr:uncharacterized protein PHACADRAFT_253318 [Phanerochaete carnosa HHB-10118-sp]EKM56277.1 hypothetical protein PHACADRAFT_253318 [Phanerochaete carnosa HHB-10118-sp]
MEENSHRWSEVIPPHTALSFAAFWDPEEGLVTFSGGELLNADLEDLPSLRDMPLDATEARSQIITLDGLSLALSSMMLDTAGLPRANRVQFSANALDEGQSMLDPYMRYLEARRKEAVRLAEEKARRRKQRIVPLDWAQLRNRILRPFSSSAHDGESEVTCDGIFEEAPRTACTTTSAPMLVHLNLKSAFSMTTTSTTGYVDVDTPSVYSQDDSSEAWSTLHEPAPHTCPNRPADTRRRLRKQRPPGPLPGDSAPASPDEVLARPAYNHMTGLAEGGGTPTGPAESLARGVRRLRSLPRISTKVPRGAEPSPTTSASDSTTVVPFPPMPPLPPVSPLSPGSPARTHSGEKTTTLRTLRKPRSVTKLVREGVERLRCHGRTSVSSWRTDEWENIFV